MGWLVEKFSAHHASFFSKPQISVESDIWSAARWEGKISPH
jgi:hypothetical protein